MPKKKGDTPEKRFQRAQFAADLLSIYSISSTQVLEALKAKEPDICHRTAQRALREGREILKLEGGPASAEKVAMLRRQLDYLQAQEARSENPNRSLQLKIIRTAAQIEKDFSAIRGLRHEPTTQKDALSPELENAFKRSQVSFKHP